MTDSILLTRPDDWHLHLRDGAALAYTVPASAATFARAIVMPNLRPPVTTVALAAEYRARILAEIPPGLRFEPLMTLYLTDVTPIAEVEAVANSDFVHAFKLYPAGATTNSDAGVTRLDPLYPLFEAMQTHDVPLLVHGEVTRPEVDIFDREARFIEESLAPLTQAFPALRVVFEHITTQAAVDFVLASGAHVAATITPQHLMHQRNDMLAGGIKPHLYCLPILKTREDLAALRKAATSGNKKFFLGTDSAPHARASKESACGCAGCYSAPYALGLYAEVFEAMDALHHLEGFAALHGPAFYRLPVNTDKLRLVKRTARIPESLPYSEADGIVPLAAGNTLGWQVVVD